jgi:predicted transcriptional regulator
MDENNEILLASIRAKIAIEKTPKKILALKCGVSRSSFSQYINGDVAMPEKVKNCLIEKLELQGHMEKFDLWDLMNK